MQSHIFKADVLPLICRVLQQAVIAVQSIYKHNWKLTLFIKLVRVSVDTFIYIHLS